MLPRKVRLIAAGTLLVLEMRSHYHIIIIDTSAEKSFATKIEVTVPGKADIYCKKSARSLNFDSLFSVFSGRKRWQRKFDLTKETKMSS